MTEVVQKQVWTGLLNAERLFRYYGLLRDKLNKRNAILTTLTFIAAISGSIFLIQSVPDVISAIAFLLVAVLTFWSIHSRYASKATIAELQCDQYEQLASQWRQLWNQGATQAQVNALNQIDIQITHGRKLDKDSKINEKAQENAYETVAAEFG